MKPWSAPVAQTPSWKNGYPDDYVTANAICLHDAFDPDADPTIRVGFRSGYYPDMSYRPTLWERLASALERWLRREEPATACARWERRALQASAQPALPWAGSIVPSVSYDGPAASRTLSRS